MTDADTARTVVGIIGNVISFVLFASPAPTFWRILKKKSTEEFRPDPYLATTMNCMLWIFYGLPIVHPNSTLVVTINGVGLGIEIGYLTIFFIYTHNKNRLKMVLWLFVEMLMLAGIVAVTLILFHTHSRRINFVGAFCVVFGVAMYTSPLTVMKKVITTKSVEFMPFYLSLANFLNGLIWVTYALIEFDLYLTVGNGLGAISGAVQLILYGCYYKSTPRKSSSQTADDEMPKGVQLSAPQLPV